MGATVATERQLLMLARALAYARRGWAVFPCKTGQKTPATPHGVKDASSDEAIITTRWSSTPEANIGLATGPPSGLFAIDIDPKNGGAESWERLTDGRKPPRTATVSTPSGGSHLYFQMPPAASIKNSTSKIAPGVDVRGAGGYVVAAGSRLADGKGYSWSYASDEAGVTEPIAEPPDWLVQALTTSAAPAPQTASPTPKPAIIIPVGTRHSTLVSMAGAMRRGGMTEDAIEIALLFENEATCMPPLPDREVSEIARSVAKYEPPERTVLLRLGTEGIETIELAGHCRQACKSGRRRAGDSFTRRAVPPGQPSRRSLAGCAPRPAAGAAADPDHARSGGCAESGPPDDDDQRLVCSEADQIRCAPVAAP